MKYICCLIAVLVCIIFPASAAEIPYAEDTDAMLSSLQTAVPKQAKSYLTNADLTNPVEFLENLKQITVSVWNAGTSSVKKSITEIFKIFVVAAICSIAAGVYTTGKYDVITLCGTALILKSAVVDLSGLGGMACDAVASMNLFSKTFLPVLTAATAASGAVSSATIRHTAMLFLTDVVITGIYKVLMPMTYTYLALAAANAVCGNDMLGKIGEFFKNSVSAVLRYGLTIYTSILGISGIISGSIDAVASKTVRLTVSSAIPVVGGIVADVSETVLAGAGIVKNTVSIFGVLVILASVLYPVFVIGVMYLAYKIAGTLSSVCVKGELIHLIDAVGTGFGLLFGMTGSCAVLLLVTIFSSMIGGGLG